LLIRLGGRYSVLPEWLWAFDLQLYRDGPFAAAAGMERTFQWHERKLFLRTGFNTRTADANGLSGVSLGGGVRFSQLSVDYAAGSLGLLGLTHRMSLAFDF
jgi:hypothetical protein